MIYKQLALLFYISFGFLAAVAKKPGKIDSDSICESEGWIFGRLEEHQHNLKTHIKNTHIKQKLKNTRKKHA